MSTYINARQAERVIELLRTYRPHTCTFTDDALAAAEKVLNKEVRASTELAAMKLELLELRKDKARLDWLIKTGCCIHQGNGERFSVFSIARGVRITGWENRTPEEAIDAAMQQEGGR